ncbi:hypothetical protein [Streptomyces sp. HUAS ZL42]|uniref:hypothetical protein n=1 Tax=Streptomyces sp. HUAS ZL42 TaxID=3231715 RepID=UPI00345ECAC8
MLSRQTDRRQLSIWTVSWRTKNVAFTAAPEHWATLALYCKGESTTGAGLDADAASPPVTGS